MPSPIVTLLTDFGTADGFVGAVKGEVLARAPDARLVDISHEIAPQDVLSAAFAIRTYEPHYNSDAVHIAVVDPGVGSDRAGLIVVTEHGKFVGPDNGIFEFVLDRASAVYRIENRAEWCRAEIAATFHARDVFGPVAGHLAYGRDPSGAGPKSPSAERFDLPRPKLEKFRAMGVIVHIDRFGNLISNIPADGIPVDRGTKVFLGHRLIGVYARTYSEVPVGRPLAVAGHSGHIEISVNQGDAARYYAVGRGEPIEIVSAQPIEGAGDVGPDKE